MKIFQQREIREAIAHAGAGGQALHLMAGSFAYLRSDTPRCFKGRAQIAHLFDQDKQRLIATAKKCGVRVIRVEREGEPGQHIDLCGKPLSHAQSMTDCQNNRPDGLGAAEAQTASALPRSAHSAIFP